MGRSRPDALKLAAATGSSGGYGLIPTIPAGATLFVRCPAGREISKVEWQIQCNKAHSYQFYRAESIGWGLGTIALSGLLNTENFSVMGTLYAGATSVTTWSTKTYSIATSMTLCAALVAKGITGGKLITLASCADPDTVVITGSDGVACTYTAHASTTTAANREFSCAGTNIQDAAELVTCINDSTYGVTGVTATQGAGTGEVLVHWTTPTGAAPPTVVGGTRRVVTTIGEELVYATADTGTITLLYRPTYVDVVGEIAPYVFSALTGTATTHAVVTQTILSSLIKDGAAVSSLTDNSTTAGTLYSHTTNGYPEAYIGVTNNDGSNAATMVVKANRVRWES